jgi:hypothetical protein
MFVIEYELTSRKCATPSLGTVKLIVSVPVGPVKETTFSASSTPSIQTVSWTVCAPSGKVE